MRGQETQACVTWPGDGSWRGRLVTLLLEPSSRMLLHHPIQAAAGSEQQGPGVFEKKLIFAYFYCINYEKDVIFIVCTRLWI